MGDYSSFYKYEKFEIIGDELISLGIFSVNGDGTMPLVVKEECDPQCGCPQPIYQWIQTEDTVCIEVITRTTTGTPYCSGDDLYADVTVEESIDDGDTWEVVSTTPTLVEAGGCATPEVQYRWTPSGWTCVGYDKYQNNIKEQSTDGGETWTVVIPEEYSASTLIESQSTDCGYVPPTPTSPKFTLTLSDSSVVSAECDSTSAITTAETYNYHSDIISATIGDCVTTIGDGAFDNCMTLTSVTIPNSVTTIGDNAFNACDLYEINLPNTLINLGDGAFKYCQNLQDVYIPVGYVPNECFSHCPNLEDVDFSPNTTTIDFGAFSSCYSLESIEIPSAIESINYEAFKNCENLASVYVHATTPPTLRNDSFDGTPIADGTGTIYVPCESVDTYKAASGWSNYASRIQGIPPCGSPTINGKYQLTLSDSSIVTAACDSTSAITSGEVSSQYSGRVVSAEIGDCVTTIGDYAFYDCSGLTSVTIPDSVTSINDGVFYDCRSLTSITIPDSVTNIGIQAFQSCISLTSVTIPDSVTSIGQYTFRDCTGLTSVNIPTGITSISRGVFYDCRSLTSITIPDSVTNIDHQAFRSCSGLTSITIPSGVTSIGMYAFQHCTSLTSVTVEATTPPTLGSNAFDGSSCPIYVPSASVSAYQSAWSAYASRIQAIP